MPLSSSELWECGKGNFSQPAILWCSSLPLDDIQRGGDLTVSKMFLFGMRFRASLLWQNYICVACNKADSDLCTDLFMLFDITEAVIFAFGVWIQFAHCTFNLSYFLAQGPPGPPGPQGADVSEFNLNKLSFTECTNQRKAHIIGYSLMQMFQPSFLYEETKSHANGDSALDKWSWTFHNSLSIIFVNSTSLTVSSDGNL